MGFFFFYNFLTWLGRQHLNYIAKYVLPLSSPKVCSISTQVFCRLSFSLYLGSALLYRHGYFSTAEAKASSAFKLVFFIFLLLHCTYTHTHFRHFQNMHEIFVYLPIVLLDLRHLISAFSLILNIPFNFRANMRGITSKLFDIIPLNNRFEIKAIISKGNMASISTEGNIFNSAKD